MYSITVDIGGTNIKAAVLDDDLNIIEYVKIPTPDNIEVLIVDEVHRLIADYIEQHELLSPFIGISSAGVVDSENGEIVYTGPTIKNFDGTNFYRALSDLSNHIKMYNDVDAALLGELAFHHYDEENIFCLALGTGIGGAFYNRDIGLYPGERHRANEIGYLLYHAEDDKTFEKRASTSALKSLMLKHGFEFETEVPKLFELAEEGHTQAKAILNQWAAYVAEGIAQIQIMYDPGLILIGGGISAQGEILLKYIEPKIHDFLPPDYGVARLQTTQTENNAALFGAVSVK
ncbi:ROK family protein [Staphylococcus carnosus]|uniref:ROK family protein n=1 Tax=Staphylococcus carnosus TaxID=1281 RepID=UPI0020A57FD0|nr:ROK family protein [Staphylococcus carnosus]UTB79549.1 N-acetylmannosamine kinase [Staphylococcus carnosus]